MTEPLPTKDVVHLRAHLGVRMELLPDDSVRGVLTVGSRSCTSDGRVSLGALATMIDVAALFGSRRAQTAPHVTTHLALRVPAPPRSGYLYGDSAVAKAGRSTTVSVVHLSDDDGRVVGLGTVTSGALGGDGGSHQPDFQRPEGDFYDPPVVPGEGPPIDEFAAMAPAGPGRYRVRFIETLRNVNGVLHGGGAAVLVEQAARQAAVDAGMSRPAIDSLDVHYVAPGLVGPFLASVDAVGDPIGRLSLLVNLTDEGRSGRLVTVGLIGARGR
jgi:acyl-coenzyme A thioesterase PaaI-like protein